MVQELQELEATRFTELLGRHAGLIHKVAYAYCRDPADREDVVQEIAVQLWRSRARYDGRSREGLAGLLLTGRVLATHATDPLYVVVAGGLGLFALGMTAMSVYLFVHVRQLDYDGSVTGIQREVERLELVARTTCSSGRCSEASSSGSRPPWCFSRRPSAWRRSDARIRPGSQATCSSARSC